MTTSKVLRAASALGGLALLAGCGGQADKPREHVALPAVSDCGTAKPTVKPKAITLTCADAGMVVHAFSWEYWSASDALGSATVTANNCEPSCADGTNLDYPVHVLLDRVKVNGAGPQFTRATIVYQGDSPMADNAQTDTTDLMLYSPSAR